MRREKEQYSNEMFSSGGIGTPGIGIIALCDITDVSDVSSNMVSMSISGIRELQRDYFSEVGFLAHRMDFVISVESTDRL